MKIINETPDKETFFNTRTVLLMSVIAADISGGLHNNSSYFTRPVNVNHLGSLCVQINGRTNGLTQIPHARWFVADHIKTF